MKYLEFPELQPPLNPTQFALISQLLPPPVPQPHWSPPPVELSRSLPVLLGMWEWLELAAGVWEPFYYFYLEFVPGPLRTHLTGALLTAEAAGEPGRLPSDLTSSAVSPYEGIFHLNHTEPLAVSEHPGSSLPLPHNVFSF